MAHGSIIKAILMSTPYRILAAVACVFVDVAQQIILNYFLIHYKGMWHYLWVLADALVIGIFIAAFTISIRDLHQPQQRKKHEDSSWKRFKQKLPGELPMGYLSWGLYSIILVAKIAVIFWDIAQQLNEKLFMGPNMLKVGVALAAVVFLLLIATHHDAEPNSSRKAYIDGLVSGVTFDILDTTQFLQVLIIQVSHVEENFELHKAILTVSCLNILLPIVPLVALSRTRYGNPIFTKMFKASHHFIYLVFINVPLFVIRLVMWHALTHDISVFLVKNIISMVMAFWKLVHECADANQTLDSTDQLGPEVDEEGHEVAEMIESAPQASRRDGDNTTVLAAGGEGAEGLTSI